MEITALGAIHAITKVVRWRTEVSDVKNQTARYKE